MSTALVALDSARTYLNDVGASIWTDAVLLPYLKEAHRDLQLLLQLNGIPVLREKSAILQVATLATTLVSLPADIIDPISLKERAFGSSEDWIPMNEKDFEPDIQPDTNLIYWAWREEQINFVGATSNREVLLRYIKGLTLPTANNSALGFINAEIFIGPQTAQYAARSVGSSTLADECLSAARQKVDMIVRTNVKGMQGMVTRRIPYRRKNRTRLLL